MNINPIAWLWLTLAIIGEIVATTSLKASKELTVLMPSIFSVPLHSPRRIFCSISFLKKVKTQAALK